MFKNSVGRPSNETIKKKKNNKSVSFKYRIYCNIINNIYIN